MTYVQRPSLRHCLAVSKAIHSKFSFLGDDTSEVNKNLLIICYLLLRMHANGLYIPEHKISIEKTEVLNLMLHLLKNQGLILPNMHIHLYHHQLMTMNLTKETLNY